ncbi:MAG: chlorite dismutase family protein [Verrucomicrobiota bacterium]
MNPRLVHFVAGDSGNWRIREIRCVIGESLPLASRLMVSSEAPSTEGSWVLKGVTSNERYVTRAEKEKLLARQEGLGRSDSTCAALIPIKKNAAWWALTQDERRDIFEAQSKHNEIGMRYLPAIARRLHHCRDLSSLEPFDFLTWFEYRPEHEAEFDALLLQLRSSPEWEFVEREVDVRLGL